MLTRQADPSLRQMHYDDSAFHDLSSSSGKGEPYLQFPWVLLAHPIACGFSVRLLASPAWNPVLNTGFPNATGARAPLLQTTVIIECARIAIRTQRPTAGRGECRPGSAIPKTPRFLPTVPNRLVFHQASEKAARFSIRSRKALLSPASRLVRCVWPFWAEDCRCASCRAESRETRRLTGPCSARKQWVLWNGQVWSVWYLSCRGLVLSRGESVWQIAYG